MVDPAETEKIMISFFIPGRMKIELFHRFLNHIRIVLLSNDNQTSFQLMFIEKRQQLGRIFDAGFS